MTLAPKAAFDVLTAAEWNELIGQLGAATTSNTDPTVSRTTTSTVFTGALTPATVCGMAFIAPPSGKVQITWRATMANSGNNYTASSFAVAAGSTVGSGAVFQSGDDARTVSTDSTTFEGQGATEYVSGLTPGATYNAYMVHRVVAGIGTFLRRTIGVVPQQA